MEKEAPSRVCSLVAWPWNCTRYQVVVSSFSAQARRANRIGGSRELFMRRMSIRVTLSYTIKKAGGYFLKVEQDTTYCDVARYTISY